MADGLQFPDAIEKHFTTDFGRRHLTHNRKVLIVCSGLSLVAVLSLRYFLETGFDSFQAILLMLLTPTGLLIAGISLWVPARRWFPVLVSLYSVLIQGVLIGVTLSSSMRESLPFLILPILLPGLWLRLRFVYVLPLCLLLWMMQFLALNFLQPPNFTHLVHWLIFITILLVSVLQNAFSYEAQCRRAFFYLLQQRRHPSDNP